MAVSGILNLNKPKGVTSFAMVALVRKLTRERRVGHAGTLDPMASGVLPILIGQGTRMMELLSSHTKTYRAEVRFGVSTDTGDAEGTVTSRSDCPPLSEQELLSVLAAFTGEILQVPPMYSALKRNGIPLYTLARKGVTVERVARATSIYSLKLLSWQPPDMAIEVECSKGTYIRSLAMDIGEKLGCGAHLTALVRLRSGSLTIEDAVTPEQFEAAVENHCWEDLLYRIDEPVLGDYAVILGEQAQKDLRDGKPLAQPALPGKPGQLCRAYSLRGEMIGLLRYEPETGLWRPQRIFSPELAPETPECSEQCKGNCERGGCGQHSDS